MNDAYFLKVQVKIIFTDVICLLFASKVVNMRVFLCSAGQITLAEFMAGAQKDEWVMNLLKLDINATNWVLQNCGKLP